MNIKRVQEKNELEALERQYRNLSEELKSLEVCKYLQDQNTYGFVKKADVSIFFLFCIADCKLLYAYMYKAFQFEIISGTI